MLRRMDEGVHHPVAMTSTRDDVTGHPAGTIIAELAVSGLWRFRVVGCEHILTEPPRGYHGKLAEAEACAMAVRERWFAAMVAEQRRGFS